MRIQDAPRRGAAPARLGRSGLVLAAGLALTLAAPVRANPLTEVPGARPAPGEAPGEALPPRDAEAVRAEAEEARAANPSATAIIRSLAPFADGNPGAPSRSPRTTVAPPCGSTPPARSISRCSSPTTAPA